MTQSNEREAFEKWSFENGYFTEYDDDGTSTVCFDEDKWIAWKARAQSPISQNEQQEVVGFIDGHDIYLYPSPPKQIPYGWKPIETAPKGESVLVAGGDCNYPCVANWSGHHEDVWCVDGQMDSYAEIGWPTHWMPLDSLPELPAAPTNTEVGE